MDYIPPIRRTHPVGRNMQHIQPLPEVPFERLDPNVRYVWLLGKLVFWAIMGFGGFFVMLVSSLGSWMLNHPLITLAGSCVLGLLVLTHVLWPFLSYRHWGYALRDTDLLIRFGVLWKTVIAVPFNRIQHVDSHAGPLTRGMGLAQLIIHTAGSQMGSVTVPGLPAQHAEALRDYLSQVGHTHANI